MIPWWIIPTLLTMLGVFFTWTASSSTFPYRAMMTFVVGVLCAAFCALVWVISFLIKALT